VVRFLEFSVAIEWESTRICYLFGFGHFYTQPESVISFYSCWVLRLILCKLHVNSGLKMKDPSLISIHLESMQTKTTEITSLTSLTVSRLDKLL
jgi:hypothetical protein